MHKRQFVAYFYFVGWSALSLGFHISLSLPNIEIHIPFGFIRIGYQRIGKDTIRKREFGKVFDVKLAKRRWKDENRIT